MNRKQRRQSQRSSVGRNPTAAQAERTQPTQAPKWPLEGSRIPMAGGVVLIAICTWIIYGQTVHVTPIDYDDHFYLTVSPYVAVPFPLTRLGAAWNEPYFANFHPVTTTTWLLDRQLSDKSEPFNGTTFRVTHLLYAILGSVLLTGLYRRLGLPAVLALAGSVVYAVHPIHTEVVAWLSARKDLLALVFVVLSMGGWLLAREASTPRQWQLRHISTILLVLLAVLSKPIAVVVPVLFVAYEFCSAPHPSVETWRWARRADQPVLTRTLGLTAIFVPLAAISAPLFHSLLKADPAHGGWLILVIAGCSLLILLATPRGADFRPNHTAGLRLFGPPFVVLSLVAGAGSAWTLWAQEQAGAVKTAPTLLQTVNAACEVVLAYVGKALIPLRMSVSYSWGSIPSLTIQGLLGALLICALLWISFRLAGSADPNRRLAAFGVFWFLIALIPISNLVPTSTKMADRYLFLPTIGAILVILAALTAWCAASRARRYGAVGGLAMLVVVFMAWSYARVEVWAGKTALWHNQPKPDLALWSAAVSTDPDDSLAHINLGLADLRLDPQDLDGALNHLHRALELIEANQSRVASNQSLNVTPAYEGLADAYLSRASQSAAQTRDPGWAAKRDDYENAVKNYQLTFQAPSGFARGDAGILRRYSDAAEALAKMDATLLIDPAGGGQEAIRRERDTLRSESEQALERAQKLLLDAHVPLTDGDYRQIVLNQGTILFNRESEASPQEKFGYYQQALARYQRAAALFPDDPRPFLDEGLCYERLAGTPQSAADRTKQIELGDAALRKALTLPTTSPDYSPELSYRVLALLYSHSGDYVAVLDWLQKARHVASSSADLAVIDKDIQTAEQIVRSSSPRR